MLVSMLLMGILPIMVGAANIKLVQKIIDLGPDDFVVYRPSDPKFGGQLTGLAIVYNDGFNSLTKDRMDNFEAQIRSVIIDSGALNDRTRTRFDSLGYWWHGLEIWTEKVDNKRGKEDDSDDANDSDDSDDSDHDPAEPERWATFVDARDFKATYEQLVAISEALRQFPAWRQFKLKVKKCPDPLWKGVRVYPPESAAKSAEHSSGTELLQAPSDIFQELKPIPVNEVSIFYTAERAQTGPGFPEGVRVNFLQSLADDDVEKEKEAIRDHLYSLEFVLNRQSYPWSDYDKRLKFTSKEIFIRRQYQRNTNVENLPGFYTKHREPGTATFKTWALDIVVDTVPNVRDDKTGRVVPPVDRDAIAKMAESIRDYYRSQGTTALRRAILYPFQATEWKEKFPPGEPGETS